MPMRSRTRAMPATPVGRRRAQARADLTPTGLMHSLGLRPWQLHLFSLVTVYLCIALWIRAKTVDQAERGNAERRALFVGLWPPMFWLIGDALEQRERR